VNGSASRCLLDLLAATRLNPFASTIVSADAVRTLGSKTRSAARIDTSYFSDSNPKEPAMPQQPEGTSS